MIFGLMADELFSQFEKMSKNMSATTEKNISDECI